MPQSSEHNLLVRTFVNILQEFSDLQLYNYVEAERGELDFACDLCKDWKRTIVGQTMWKNDDLNKDLLSFITRPDADIWAYIIRDTYKHKKALGEATQSLKNSIAREHMFKLQPFTVDPNFRADDEKSVKEMSDNLRRQIVENLLFNVMFGNLSGGDIRLVLDRGGAISLAILHTVATSRVPNRSQLAKRLGVGTESVNRIIFMLLGMGLLSDTSIVTALEGHYYVTLKGRALLRLLGIIKSEVSNDAMRSELIYILKYLRIEPPRLTSIISLTSLDDSSLNHSNIDNLIDFLYDDIIGWSEQEIGSFLLNSTVSNANKWPNQVAFMRLVGMVRDLEKAWDIDLRDQTFETPSWEKDPRYPWEKDPTYFTVLEYPLVNKIYLKKLFFSLKRAFLKVGLDHLNVSIAGKDGGEAVYIREAAIKIEPVYLIKNDQMSTVKMPAWNIDIPSKTKDPDSPDFTVVDIRTHKTMDSVENVVEEVLHMILARKDIWSSL